MPESRDRTEISQLKRARHDPIDVAVIAKGLHGSADRRVDGTVGPFGHRIGDVESFEEHRRNLDGASRVGVEVRKLRVGSKATAGTVDGLSLGAENPLRFVCVRWVCHDNSGRGAQGTEGPSRHAGLRRCLGRGGHLRDVAPEVATGGVVVVVGGRVVVVVGEVVVVGAGDGEALPGSDEVGVVVGGKVVGVEVFDVEVVGTCAGTGLKDALAPGCSFATTTPMAMVAPVAPKTAKRVSSRRRTSARRLVSGESDDGRALIDQVLGSASASWKRQREPSGCTTPEVRCERCQVWTYTSKPGVDGGRASAGGSGGGHLFTLRIGTYANMTTSRERFWDLHSPLQRHVHVMIPG